MPIGPAQDSSQSQYMEPTQTGSESAAENTSEAHDNQEQAECNPLHKICLWMEVLPRREGLSAPVALKQRTEDTC